MKKFIMIVLAMLALAGCKCKDHANDGAATFEVLKQDAYSGREERWNLFITSQKELDALYKESGWENVPSVDFSKNNVVALFLGQKPNGSYSIGIENILIKDDTATVKVLESRSQGNATMAITTPCCIALIPKTGKIVFE